MVTTRGTSTTRGTATTRTLPGTPSTWSRCSDRHARKGEDDGVLHGVWQRLQFLQAIDVLLVAKGNCPEDLFVFVSGGRKEGCEEERARESDGKERWYKYSGRGSHHDWSPCFFFALAARQGTDPGG